MNTDVDAHIPHNLSRPYVHLLETKLDPQILRLMKLL